MPPKPQMKRSKRTRVQVNSDTASPFHPADRAQQGLRPCPNPALVAAESQLLRRAGGGTADQPKCDSTMSLTTRAGQTRTNATQTANEAVQAHSRTGQQRHRVSLSSRRPGAAGPATMPESRACRGGITAATTSRRRDCRPSEVRFRHVIDYASGANQDKCHSNRK